MSVSEKKCLKRLMRDLEELTKSPVDNVSAAPLENNMLEWHCNIRQDKIIFHLILFFSPDYPSKSPSAEFVPRGYSYGGGAVKPGRKGTQICLSIFSDFEVVHTEWASDIGHGWSPGYTVQTILMNVASFLAENQTTSDCLYVNNLKISKTFTCTDCGHSYEMPFPSLSDVVKDTCADKVTNITTAVATLVVERPTIVDYFSKVKFNDEGPLSDDDIFGYGLIVSGSPGRAKLTTPCEFLTIQSFNEMKRTMDKARSVLKEPLSFFLPLFIHPVHGAIIQDDFESVMHDLSNGVIVSGIGNLLVEDMVLRTLPNLMCATLVHLFKELKQANENFLNGYFALHRLFLWAIDTYPGIQDKVEMSIKDFVENESRRTKTACPDIGQWLMLLAVSKRFRWHDVAEAYLSECWRRNVMWFIKDDPVLKDDSIDKEYRLENTFKRTSVSRNLLAFQVIFLDIAWPESMSRDQIIQRYDDNWGFPTKDMVTRMKTECHKISNEIHTYADWYTVVNLPVPSDDEIFESLVDALLFATTTHGYHFQ
ncbi:unnamed protein product [Candidula unifasciata]|uniref:UBC core domain-containing protein n=1 Tax=Candidula unifasciata TaxID=100452 RepID=A0A8S4A369_9EUPU|nr:unnamed protein product [Candidula unifasciata]